MEQILFPQPMIAQIIPMIRGQNNHCIGHLTCFIQMIQNATQFIVTLFDQSHVGWDHLVAHIVALKRLRDLVLLIGSIDGLGIFQFNLVAQGGGTSAGVNML